MSTSTTWRHVLSLGVSCFFWASCSYSDWAVIGAAVQCIDGQRLSLVAVEWSSSDSSDFNPIPSGYRQLEGQSEIECNVGTAKVATNISVFPPAARGMGMGAGYVSIDNLTVAGLPIFGKRTAFNWAIPGSDRALTKITVSLKESAPFVEVCDTEACYQEWLIRDVMLNNTYKTSHGQSVGRGSSNAASRATLLVKRARSTVQDRNLRCEKRAVGLFEVCIVGHQNPQFAVMGA